MAGSELVALASMLGLQTYITLGFEFLCVFVF